MHIISLFLFFIVPANIILLCLFGLGFHKRIGSMLTMLVSYAVGPLLTGLFFYFLINFIPNKGNNFYLVFLLSIWLVVFIIFSKKFILIIFEAHKFFLKSAWRVLKKINFLIVFVVIFFISTYFIQCMLFPPVENDSALYITQSEAFYENKNLSWQKENSIIINGDDKYQYNMAIRPALPLFIASTYLFTGSHQNYIVFQFFSFYYYTVLLVVFLYVVSLMCKLSGRNSEKSFAYGLVLFSLSLPIAMPLVFNAKELSIYCLVLLSLLIFNNLIKADKKDEVHNGILLGLVMGVNMFINFHGTITTAIVILMYFLIAGIARRTLAIGFLITTAALFFCFFEPLYYIRFIFLDTLKYSIPISEVSHSSENSLKLFYGFKSTFELYINGKFQLFSNILFYGIFFWLFVGIIIKDFKNIIKNNFSKIILIFMGIYSILIIDPFSLNKNPNAIILNGSSKYPSLIFLLSLVFLSVHIDKYISKFSKFIENNWKKIIPIMSIILLISIVFKENIKPIIIKIMLLVLQNNREELLNKDKIEIGFWYLIISISVFVVGTLVVKKLNRLSIKFFFLVSAVNILVIAPLVFYDFGKVPIIKTFKYVSKDRGAKLENMTHEGAIFKVYNHAKVILPRGTVVKTDFAELYPYENYFQLAVNSDVGEDSYIISSKGCNFFKVLYSAKNVSLCHK